MDPEENTNEPGAITPTLGEELADIAPLDVSDEVSSPEVDPKHIENLYKLANLKKSEGWKLLTEQIDSDIHNLSNIHLTVPLNEIRSTENYGAKVLAARLAMEHLKSLKNMVELADKSYNDIRKKQEEEAKKES